MQYEELSPTIPAIKWGRDHENDARTEYFDIVKETHVNCQVDFCGLVINPKYPYMAASPDGKCSCLCCGTRLIEIKCPYSVRNANPNHVKKAGFYLKNKSGKLLLSRSHTYYSQVQHQLLIAEEEVCDFVCWTPKGIFIETIDIDPDYRENVPKCKKFFLQYILPELLTHRFLDNGLKTDIVDQMMTKHIVFVAKTLMIACDNSECSFEWYHYSCVGIKRRPKGSWLCPKCK